MAHEPIDARTLAALAVLEVCGTLRGLIADLQRQQLAFDACLMTEYPAAVDGELQALIGD